MANYLGQFPVDIKDTPYADYTPADWALEYIGRYGGIDGSHHKDWVLDQVSRILHGTPVQVTHHKWDDGQEEYRIRTGEEPPQAYHDWVRKLREPWNEELEAFEYDYSVGIAP